MKHGSTFCSEESAQMLLATGLVLLLALLSMALYAVKVAGLGDPYDPSNVLEVGGEVQSVWQPLVENRSTEFSAAGLDWNASCNAAAISAVADLMRHGEHRGVEVMIIDINVTNVSGIFTIRASAGITDHQSRLQFDLQARVDLNP
uniref:Uncharacterized protein n=1 Tax=uncultured marine group II/III euryarchaeote KM3_109_G01 TaxID=1457850 RepID=A0A075G7F7_9EURY|nr:hypothetical protein [uncultured marine group II/III euryarchaeote KM3_109_G01]